MKKELKIINGDMLSIKKGVLIHQVNAKHVMGSGIAKQIRAMYPQHYNDYMKADMFMGTMVVSTINDDLDIIGFIAQATYGRTGIHTDYTAFEMCLEELKRIHSCDKTIEYYMPYGIGCGLAGGDWNIIYKMIQDICPFVTLVKYEVEMR